MNGMHYSPSKCKSSVIETVVRIEYPFHYFGYFVLKLHNVKSYLTQNN